MGWNTKETVRQVKITGINSRKIEEDSGKIGVYNLVKRANWIGELKKAEQNSKSRVESPKKIKPANEPLSISLRTLENPIIQLKLIKILKWFITGDQFE